MLLMPYWSSHSLEEKRQALPILQLLQHYLFQNEICSILRLLQRPKFYPGFCLVALRTTDSKVFQL